MSFAITASSRFSRLIKRLQKKYRSIPDDFATLLEELAANPKAGEPLGRDCYKVRASPRRTKAKAAELELSPA